jgi:hypothetical protein
VNSAIWAQGAHGHVVATLEKRIDFFVSHANEITLLHAARWYLLSHGSPSVLFATLLSVTDFGQMGKEFASK